EEALIALVGELRVGDRDLAPNAGQGEMLSPVGGLTEPRLDQFVDCRIDAADEKTGNTGNSARIAAARDQVFKAVEITLDDALVDLLREKQRDVDVDPVARQPTAGRQARRRRR